MARFDLTDFERPVIEPLLPAGPRAGAAQPARGEAGGLQAGAEQHLLASADRSAPGRRPGPLWATYDVREPLQPLAPGCLRADIGSCVNGLR